MDAMNKLAKNAHFTHALRPQVELNSELTLDRRSWYTAIATASVRRDIVAVVVKSDFHHH